MTDKFKLHPLTFLAVVIICATCVAVSYFRYRTVQAELRSNIDAANALNNTVENLRQIKPPP